MMPRQRSRMRDEHIGPQPCAVIRAGTVMAQEPDKAGALLAVPHEDAPMLLLLIKFA